MPQLHANYGYHTIKQLLNWLKKAHETHSDAVVSFSVYNREARDYFRSQLPDYIFIQLHLDEEELVKRHIGMSLKKPALVKN